ncbi:MAG: transporter [Deltaproteobacteria bacterium]|nr:transporter [Deltaproteobacteria bacterium]
MLAVLVAALGYFVDIYDLILFGMVRTASLKDLGVCTGLADAACKTALTDQGLYLLNMQMGGMLVGGILWGVLGDKKGRLSVLFGSITLYSLANIANGLVGDVSSMHSIDVYAVCRLIAGIGLAGELGAGITLVSELMGRHNRGIGTTVVAALGVSGGIVAGIVGGAFGHVVDWTTAYYIGGGLGLALLLLRIGVVESGMFATTFANKHVARGNFFQLFTSRRRLVRYIGIILIGIPVWYVIGILFTLSPELGAALGLDPAPNPARALMFVYAGCTLGGMASGLLSQKLRSRKKTLAIFLVAVTLSVTAYFTLGGRSLDGFYVLALVGGLSTGYWAVFVSTAAELFGTNLRATAATTVPNFVRGSLVPVALAFSALKGTLGLLGAAIAVGAATIVLAFIGLLMIHETFAVDLDFHESDEPLVPPARLVQ